MKKILIISHSQKIGGAEKCLVELSKGLKTRGYYLTVVLPSIGENYNSFTDYADEVIINSYPWWLKNNENSPFRIIFRSFLSHLKAIYTFYKIIKVTKPHVLINNTVAVPSAIIASRAFRVANIWFIHEFGDIDHNFKFEFSKNLSFYIIKKCSNNIFVNSQMMLDYYSVQLKRNDLVRVDYSIDKPIIENCTSHFEDNEVINIYVIGQIQDGKGQIDALKAINYLSNQKLFINLYIIGQVSDYVYYDVLLKYIDAHNLSNVHFRPHNNNPFNFVLKNAIGLVCSRNEAFGRITIEYMKLGIPVIGLKKPNTSNLIDNGVNGLLYNENNIEDLCEKIILLFNDKLLRNKIIKNGINFSECNFNTEKYIEPFINVIEDKNETFFT
jgi:glycosyltransferase involved in cell wall biosynthesis